MKQNEYELSLGLMMDKEELEKIGKIVFGRDWKSPMARALGISVRHMRRLARGDTVISEMKVARIRDVCLREAEKLERLACRVREISSEI